MSDISVDERINLIQTKIHAISESMYKAGWNDAIKAMMEKLGGLEMKTDKEDKE